MTLYNPVTDAFTYYTPTETPKVELEDPLKGITDISDWASRITPNGIPIAKANTPKVEKFNMDFLDKMASTHSEQTFIPSDDPNFEGGSLIDNERFAYEYLVKKGLPKGTSAGIVGNLYHEGLANPTKTSKDSRGTTSYGAAQFNSKGEYPKLLEWAKKKGIQGNPSLSQQLDFIVDVIKERAGLSPLLNDKLTPTEASFIWGSQFEKFAGDNGTGYKNRGDSHHKKRAARANKIFKTYG